MNETFKSALLEKALSKIDNAALGELFREAVVAAKARGATNLDMAEIVRDMFLEGDLHKVPNKAALEVTAPVSASGMDNEEVVARFSDFAKQITDGHTENYNKVAKMLEEMGGSMKALALALQDTVELVKGKKKPPVKKAEEDEEDEEDEQDINIAVEQNEDDEEEEGKSKAKSLRASVAKDILTKAEDEEEEDEEGEQNIDMAGEQSEDEEDEEEGKAKSLSDASKVKFAKALIGGAKDAMKSDGAAKGVRRQVEKAARRALMLAKGAAGSKDKQIAKAAKAIQDSVEEFMYIHDIAAKAKMKGKKAKPTGNQKVWPDHEGFEKSMQKIQGDLNGLMDVVNALSKRGGSGMPSIEVLGADSPIVKGGVDYFKDKIKMIETKANDGTLNGPDADTALELITLMQSAKEGFIPGAVVTNTLKTSNSNVRDQFPEWVEEARS